MFRQEDVNINWWWDSWELMGWVQRADTVLGVPVQGAGRSLTWTGTGPHRGPWPSKKLLEGHQSRTKVIQEAPGVHWCQLPDTGDWGAGGWARSAWAWLFKQRLAQGCESQGKPWLQWPWDGGVQDPEMRKMVVSRPWISGEQFLTHFPITSA